jgi:NAD(P)-dependent dehydrogenase (short-subunit alcohol dehydrogenase family)
MEVPMPRRTCLITGATSGLGRATAEVLAGAGDTLLLPCRDPAAATRVEAELRSAAGHLRIHTLPCDLARPATVDATSAAVLERFDHLDLLILNAGATPLERSLSPAGVELGWHTSYLGHFQLLQRLMPALGRGSRVIVLAGMYQAYGQLRLDDLDWHERPWSWSQAAYDTQLARVLFTVEAAARLRDRGVTVNAVHPGAVRTRAQDVLPWPTRLLVDTLMGFVFASPARGAQTILRLADDPALAEVTGVWFRRFQPSAPHPLVQDAGARRALWDRSLELLAAG